jgi:hypothetical protein
MRVEYSEALTDIPIVIELLDDDDKPVGMKLEGKVRVGHPPLLKPGNPIFVPYAVTFNMLRFTRYGTYRFRISTGSVVLADTPFNILQPLGAATSGT